MSSATSYDVPSRERRVAVVGGGIVGVLTALAFLREGDDVTLVDRGLPEARCSFGNAGSLSPGSVAPLGMPGVLSKVPGMLLMGSAPLRVRPRYALRALPWLTRFVLASAPHRIEEISHALRDLLSDSIVLYSKLLNDIHAQDLIQRRGQLQLYPNLPARDADASVWKLRRSRGVVVEDVSRDEIKQLEPAIGERYNCGIYLPNEGLVSNPARLIETLTSVFVSSGGNVLQAHVKGFVDGGDRAKYVETTAGNIPSDIIVVAAGAWSNALARQAGDDLPLETQRGYHITLPHAGVSLSRPIVAADRKYFVSPMETGIRVAGTVEFDSLEAPPDERRIAALRRSVPELLPGIDVTDASTWMGHRPCMPDSLPVLDRSSRFSNVLYAFGNGHLGLTGAPKMAEVVVALASGRKPSIDLTPFRASRFKLFNKKRKIARETGASDQNNTADTKAYRG